MDSQFLFQKKNRNVIKKKTQLKFFGFETL